MPSNYNTTNSASRKKWGSGSFMTSSARQGTNENNVDEDQPSLHQQRSNHFVQDNTHSANDGSGDNDDINLFESIGKELDQNEEVEDGGGTKIGDNNTTTNGIGRNQLERPRNSNMDIDRLSISNDDNDVGQSHHDEEDEEELAIPTAMVEEEEDDNLMTNEQSSGMNKTTESTTSQNINDNRNGAAIQSSKRRKSSNAAASTIKKLSPPRFSFQSSSSVKSKPKPTSFKTPSNNKSLPSRELFTNNTMPQQRSTITKSTQKLSTTTTQKRKQRHSFRPSSTGNVSSLATPAVNSNVREMEFVPTFISNNNAKGKSSPKDAPADEDDNDDDNGDNGDNIKVSAYSNNMITNHQQQQRKARRSESSKSSGYLVQRLRSLRSTDQRMSMRLRNAQYNNNSGTTGGGGIMSRKRRRSSDHHLNPENMATSTLDVTVRYCDKSFSSAGCNSNSASLLGEGKSVLLAYIHCCAMTKHQKDKPDIMMQSESELPSFPCHAWIVMANDVIREHGLVQNDDNDDIATSSTTISTKQLRLYDAVIIPPRLVNMDEEDDESNLAAAQVEMNTKHKMPTIICTHISKAYSAQQELPPLQDVSFDQFS